MIKAKHHWFLYPFLVWLGWVRMNIHFNQINMIGRLGKTHLPLLIIANHFSWWDGFFISSLNKKKFKKKLHIMMEEKQLVENILLNKGGVYSLKKNSKDVIKSLKYTVGLLKQNENMVALFPQGKFESIYQHPLHFEKGLDWILRKTPNEIQMVFVANQVEYFESVKPNLFSYFEEYSHEGKTIADIEKDYNRFFEHCHKRNRTKKNS
jgi:1-acyl-sn-glycerol-3-phosphate acyltransferase